MLAVTCAVIVSSLSAGADPFRPQKANGVDAKLFPGAYGVLASERLMFPVDMVDWPLKRPVHNGQQSPGQGACRA